MSKLSRKIFLPLLLLLVACEGNPAGENTPLPTRTALAEVAATPLLTNTATPPQSTATQTVAPTMTNPPTATATETRPLTATIHPALTVPFQFENLGLVFPIGEDNSWEDTFVYAPEVVYHEGLFHLFYSGISGQGTGFPSAIGYATSADGINFERHPHNPIVQAAAGSARDYHVPVVTILDDGTWVMYLDEKQGSAFQNNIIRRATAPAPEGPWTVDEMPVIEAENRWLQRLIPQNIIGFDGQFWLFYEARPTGTIQSAIGALRSADGVRFEPYDDPATSEDFSGADPLLTGSGESGSWNQSGAGSPMLFPPENGMGMFYLGDGARRARNGDGVSLKLGYAFSSDGINWVDHPGNPLFEIMGESGRPYLGSAIVDAKTFHIYYVLNEGAAGIGVIRVLH